MSDESKRQTVGLALLAKNEAPRILNLLDSIEGCFDRVTLLDTGSTDDTVEVFQEWALKQVGMTYAVGHYEWTDNFADARTYSDQLLLYGDTRFPHEEKPMVDWKVWADCDDVLRVESKDVFRSLVNNAPTSVAGFMVDYDYARHPDTGAVISYLKRERIVRAGSGKWMGHVHEAQLIDDGQVVQVDPAVLLYIHCKHLDGDTVEGSNDRNLRILRKWNEDEPNNPRVLGYLGVELALKGEHEEAVSFYRAYLELKTGWDEERAQVHSRLASSLLHLGRNSEAEIAARDGVMYLPTWPDNYLRLAEAYLESGDGVKAEHWARRVLEMGPPQGTLLIINPADYSFQAMKVLAGSLGHQGKIEEALEYGKQASGIIRDQSLLQAMNLWASASKREHTASTFAMCAEQLISHDEQLKALTLLENCVPVFATDHPRIVALRSMLRERLAWINTPVDYSVHYEVGGSKPEDMIPDDKVDALCEYLPRTQYLLDGITEQIELANA